MEGQIVGDIRASAVLGFEIPLIAGAAAGKA